MLASSYPGSNVKECASCLDKQTSEKQFWHHEHKSENLTSQMHGQYLFMPMQWVTEIKDVRCVSKKNDFDFAHAAQSHVA